ncbi:MAG: hypothetical protein HY735_15120 [Verrucomicrobia bacterium]|nr:hypothetical protein [Verrucomicrobiota bacterium]
MDPQREKFLNLKHLLARMNVEEAAGYLGMSPHDIPILVANGLLKPLGNPVQSSVKYFATVTLQELWADTKWLHRASATIREHWSEKNARKSKQSEFSPIAESAAMQRA